MLCELNRSVCVIGPFYSAPDIGLREGERQWRGGAAGSVAHWPSVAGQECWFMGAFIDFLFLRLWQPCRMTGAAIEPLSGSPGASGEGKALCLHCLTILHTRQRTAVEKRLPVWMKWIVGLVRERKGETACAPLASMHICILCSSSGISQGHAGKVCQREWGGRVEISRESGSSAALVLVDGAASLKLILLIGLWADCCTAGLIC